MRTAMILLMSAGACSALAQAGVSPRDPDPVVMTGTDLPALLGTPTGDIVAFRYMIAWTRIRVQIDERKRVDFGRVYNQAPIGLTTTAYADPNTYVGPDANPAFDANDELVFMARDAGGLAPPSAGQPAGTLPGSGLQLELSDPLDGSLSYVYLFVRDGSPLPPLGPALVQYAFNLLGGSYIPNYSTLTGPNPENSRVQTVSYEVHFSDRWIRDELRVSAGGASGADILDRHKAMFGPGICTRTEDTFSAGEGAFFVNKSGPVRAIRSYIGANSGVLTQRDHFFYERREDVLTILRVHSIPGVMDLFDYSPAAIGMSYFNDLNLTGVTVDGLQDAIVPGPLSWEMVTGSQGTLIMPATIDTDIPGFAYTSFYSDDALPLVVQCTGDGQEIATSGIWVNATIPNTDPSLGAANRFVGRRVIYYEPPNQSTALAALRFDQAVTPLGVTVSPFGICPGDADGSGAVDLSDLAIVLSEFGMTGAGLAGDVDSDGDVDLSDLAIVLAHFGLTCA